MARQIAVSFLRSSYPAFGFSNFEIFTRLLRLFFVLQAFFGMANPPSPSLSLSVFVIGLNVFWVGDFFKLSDAFRIGSFPCEEPYEAPGELSALRATGQGVGKSPSWPTYWLPRFGETKRTSQ